MIWKWTFCKKFRKFGPFAKLKENSDPMILYRLCVNNEIPIDLHTHVCVCKLIGISLFEHAASTSVLIRLILARKYIVSDAI